MRRTMSVFSIALVCVLIALPALAQNPTGTVTGKVIYNGEPLPGVTVQLSSPALQGTKTAISTGNGDYLFRHLPPGTYTVSFTLDGFKEQTSEVKVSAVQTRTLDAEMYEESFAEEIVVTGSYETISDSVQAQTTYEQSMVEKLAIDRTLEAAVTLSPGVNTTGPSNNISIAGGQSFDNLWLINGVVVNENIRGQSLPLFIEDAIQETTTSTSGVSAEYGRFQGGVVNMITKSGGNDFQGSFRINLTNDDWISRTELSPERADSVNQSYEATFGGYIMRDRLWFFLAGRDKSLSENRTTDYTLIPYPYGDDERRYEAKLTFSLNQSHRLIGSYIEVERTRQNTDFSRILDTASLNPNRGDPQDIMSFNYTGVLTENVFVEAQYSERNYLIGVGSGSPTTDIIGGTLLLDQSRRSSRYHTPTFCAAPECKQEERNNEDLLAKGSWFISSDTAGSHDLVFGFDRYNDIRIQDNHQQGSDFRIYGSTAIIDDSNYVWPVFAPWDNDLGLRDTYYRWTPIFAAPEGTDFITNSLFVNDTWRFNEKWTFSLGMRYDINDGTDSSGNKVADDSKFSPRLGVTYDVKGDGDLILKASYAHYVTGITQGIHNDAGAGGSPAWTKLEYGADLGATCFNCDAYFAYQAGDPNWQSLLDGNQDDAIQHWYDWFTANGGTSELPGFSGGSFPGFTPQILQSLSSPHTEEFSIGATKRLGTRGVIRADYIHREGNDFYVSVSEPGRYVDTGFVGEVDMLTIENDPGVYTRDYDGLLLNAQYRLNDSWSLGGNWTWSHATGNLDGETANSGPVAGTLTQYPEYREASWNAPNGNLEVDQRTKIRAWAVWDAISSSHHNLSLSLLWNYWSGNNYSLDDTLDPRDYVTNPGYITPPSSVTYYFSGRRQEQWDDITRADLALNYSFFVNAWGADLEFFIQPEIINIFNESGQDGGDDTVNIIQDFDPFTETPVEGTHWEKDSDFGTPTSEGDFQRPREFRVSLGIRF